MICKDFEKLIHLYLDQKLDEQKKKEVEKHLEECQKCRERFEALKLVEEKAKGIKIPEPGDAYWESFSQRVRERIASKQKQPFGVKVKDFFATIFVLSPSRLKVAAAVASLVLVFIIGKLYIDYKGTIPERLKPVERETPVVEGPKTEKEKPAPAPQKPAPKTEKKGVVEQKGPRIKEEVTNEVEKPTPPIQPESKEVAAGAGAEPMAKKAVTRDIAKKGPVAGALEQEVARPVEMPEAPKAAMRAMADVEKKKTKPESKIMGEHTLDKITLQETHKYLFADSIEILDVDYHHEHLNADSLRVIIDFWKKFIQDNPDDPAVEYIYLQIAAAYYYSFDKTKDEAIREQGIKEIEQFLKISQKEEIKEELIKRVEKLKGLKEK